MWYRFEKEWSRQETCVVEADSLEEAIRLAEEEGYEENDANPDEDPLLSVQVQVGETEDDMYDADYDEIDVDEFYRILDED